MHLRVVNHTWFENEITYLNDLEKNQDCVHFIVFRLPSEIIHPAFFNAEDERQT